MLFQELLTGDWDYIVGWAFGLNAYQIMPWDYIAIIKITFISGLILVLGIVLLKIIVDLSA